MNRVAYVMRKSIIVNILLATSKIVAGIIGKSGALVADGVHSFSDLVTDIFAIIGSFLSRKPADEKHPFGHGRIEYLTSVVISIVIIMLGFFIIYSSFIREITFPSVIVVIVTILAIFSKLLLSNYIIKQGKKYNSNILISSGYESRTDAFSAVVVLVSYILMLLSNKIEIFKYADKVAIIIVGLMILNIGIRLLIDNVNSLLGETETNEEKLNIIKSIILEDIRIIAIDKLYLLKYGTYYELISELKMNQNDELKDVHDCIETIEKKLKKNIKSIKYVTIHVNPSGEK